VAMTTPASTESTFASHPLKIATLFYLATLGGANVCNLEKQIGSLEVGKAFDAIVVDIRNDGLTQNPNLWGVADDEDVGIDSSRGKGDDQLGNPNVSAAGATKKEELDAMLERFLFCGDDRNIKRVYVQGRFIGGADFGAGA
jgi:guanine deaminase